MFLSPPKHLSRWYKGGYQDWLQEQQWANALRIRQEAFLDLSPGETPTQITQVALQLAATQVCQHLRDLALAARNPNVEADSESLNRLLNTVCRVNRELFEMQKYNHQVEREEDIYEAKRQADLEKLEDLHTQGRALTEVLRRLHPEKFRDDSSEDPAPSAESSCAKSS